MLFLVAFVACCAVAASLEAEVAERMVAELDAMLDRGDDRIIGIMDIELIGSSFDR